MVGRTGRSHRHPSEAHRGPSRSNECRTSRWTVCASAARATGLVIVLSFAAGCGRQTPQLASANYEVRRETSSALCKVNLTTAAPWGSRVSGPFGTGKEACASALGLYDDTATEPNKCWSYDAGTKQACTADGVTLP